MRKKNYGITVGIFIAAAVMLYCMQKQGLDQELDAQRTTNAHLQERIDELKRQEVGGKSALPSIPLQTVVSVPIPPDPPASAAFQKAAFDLTSFNERFPDSQAVMGFSLAEAEAFYRLLVSQAPEGEMVSLIGGVRLERWKEYMKSIESRRMVSSLKSLLKSGFYPLTDAQADFLLPVLITEQQRRQKDVDERSKTRPNDDLATIEFDELTLMQYEASYRRVIESSRAILRPEQIALLQSSMNAELNSWRTIFQTNRVQVEAGIKLSLVPRH